MKKKAKAEQYPEDEKYYIWLIRKFGKRDAKSLYEMYLNLGNVDHEFETKSKS